MDAKAAPARAESIAKTVKRARLALCYHGRVFSERMKPASHHHLTAIERALDTIEDSLRCALDIERLALDCGMSYWHFHRAFAALTGETVGSYLRRRRLSAAAREALRSRKRLVEIAIDYQFGSHEAFSRAFRAMFKVSPSQFRRDPISLWSARPRLDADRLRHLSKLSLEPQIVELPSLRLVGLTTRFFGYSSERANNSVALPLHWRTHRERISCIPDSAGPFRYGAWDDLPPNTRVDPDEFIYLAGRAVETAAPPPDGMEDWAAPAGRYALFTHKGHIHRIGETINYVYAAWLPRAGFERGKSFDLERYDHRFTPDSDQSEFDYLVPLAD